MDPKKISALVLTVCGVVIFASIVIFLNKWLVYPSIVILAISLFFALLLKLISRFIPAFSIEGSNKGRRRFAVSVMVSALFFYFSGWSANEYILPAMFQPKSLLGDAGILLLSLSLGLCVLKPNGKTISFTVFFSIALLMFLFLDIESRSDEVSSSKNIKSLGYLAYVKEEKSAEKNGVVIYKNGLADKGLNVYNSWELPGAYVMDMMGNVLHKWSLEGSSPKWQYVKLLKNGDLLLIIKDVMLARLGWDSSVKWSNKDRFHHEIAVVSNGDIYSLTRREEWVSFYGLPVPILNDYLTVLSEDGVVKKKVSFFNLLRDRIPARRFAEVMVKAGSPEQLVKALKRKWTGDEIVTEASFFDIIHTNTLEIIDRDIDDIFKKGNIIFCAAEQDLIGVIDPTREKVIWAWGKGHLEMPHFPTLLESGNILVFDNGVRRGFTSIVELNPSTGGIVWKYEDSPPNAFFSPWGGNNQSLPNGDILVTDSANGRVIEITKNGEIVWEFYNPVKDDQGRRGTIYRMSRISDVENYNGLKDLKSGTAAP